MAEHGFGGGGGVRRRFDVFDAIGAPIAERRVLYLEFGVAEGMSMRYWSRRLRHPESRLHGFDSFEGLPASWIRGRPAGHFSQNGHAPVVEDDRVTFHKGWFHATLPGFALPERELLLVNLDADLYSSTALVLDWLADKLRPGDLLYFDEFNHRADELRAFDEFLERTGIECTLAAATRDYAHVGFRVERVPGRALSSR
jgi:Macrocin-O-methyltransferase (TylF)